MFVFSVTVRVDDQRLLERGRSVRHSDRQRRRPVWNAIQHRHTVVGTQRQAVQRLGGCRRQEEQIRSVSALFILLVSQNVSSPRPHHEEQISY